MPVEIWKAAGYCIVVVCSALIFWDFARKGAISTTSQQSLISKGERIIAIAFIGIGIFLRVAFLAEFQGGKLTSDENLMSIIYPSALFSGEPIAGLGKAFHIVVLDAWLKLFGFSVITIRWLSTFISLVGLGLLFLSLRVLCGERIALWATTLLSISVFGIYFGRLGNELFWVIPFASLCLCLFAYWTLRPSLLLAAAGGCAAALGLFTYPGFHMALVAVLGGLAAAWLWAFLWSSDKRAELMPNHETVLGLVATFVSFLAVAGFGLILNSTILAPPPDTSFIGGSASLDLSAESVMASMRQLLFDLFVRASSWYLVFPEMPFVEVVFWPFFIAGVLISWRGDTSWRLRGIILSMPAVIVLSSFTGPYPGMRRAVYFLLPFYFFSAVGIVYFLSISKSWSIRHVQRPRIGLPHLVFPILIVIALSHSVYYQLTYGRQAVSWNFGEGFGTRKIPLEYLSHILRSKDVILARHEFEKYFDHLIYEHYPKLAKRYGSLPKNAWGVHFLEDSDDPVIQAMGYTDNWVFLSWTPDEIVKLASDVPLCIDVSGIGNADLPIPARRHSPHLESTKSLCTTDGRFGGLNSEFQMGYLHAEERFLHQLKCAGPYCDKSRPEFIYTLGGPVTFLLSPEKELCEPGCQLVLKLANPQPNRRSRVLIANSLIGVLSIENLDRESTARFHIPSEAIGEHGPIEISIVPETGDFLGWDVVSAKVTRAEETTIDE